MDQKKLLMIAAGCGGAVFLGALLPWVSIPSAEVMGVTVGGGSIGGTQFTVGVFVLLLGLVGGAAALLMAMGKTDVVKLTPQQYVLIAGGALGLAALLTLIKFFELSSKGFGLWLCLLGSLGGAACMFLVLKEKGLIPSTGSGDGGAADSGDGGADGSGDGDEGSSGDGDEGSSGDGDK